VTGPAAHEVCLRLTDKRPGAARLAELRTFRVQGSREVIDRGLVIWFPGPSSYTGEDLLELHHHGGVAVSSAMLDAVLATPGVRLADPGEFTRRAFHAGKLDLTQVEGLADLIDASTRAQARQAIRLLDGELGRTCERWRERLITAAALVEAEIDFGTDQDIPDQLDAVNPILNSVCDEIRSALSGAGRAERLREGMTVAVIGPPNSGKSSLVNRLAHRDVAIVTDRPGTTRDVLEVHLELDGLPVTLLDTAGIRETSDPIEKEGIARARYRAKSADFRLVLLDASSPNLGIGEDGELTVVNKIDVSMPPPSWSGLAVSCRTGEGMDQLVGALRDAAFRMLGDSSAVLVNRRQRESAERVLAALSRVLDGTARDLSMIAEELRIALASFDALQGRVSVETVLDRIFAHFCIGK
jgi:tRNA modification GTPase